MMEERKIKRPDAMGEVIIPISSGRPARKITPHDSSGGSETSIVFGGDIKEVRLDWDRTEP
jgi:hypothetical protein